MTTKSSRRVPEEVAATPAEIEVAIHALTLTDWAKLRRYADLRMLRLGRKAERRTGDELLQIAVTHLLEDTRRWNKSKVEFVTFLIGAMKSISSNWAKSFKPEETYMLDADLRTESEEGERSSPLDNVRAGPPGPERRLIDRQTLDLIEGLFKDDEEAQMVLEGWQEGYDPAGVRELWGLSQNQYNTIVRRIRRNLANAGLNADHDAGSTNAQ